MEIYLKDIIALRELYLIDSIPSTFESIELITKVSAGLLQEIYDSKPKIEEGEVFIETLSTKILLTTKSIVKLGNGVKLSTLNKDSNISLLDFPSINVLTRSIIEAFLTMEYLFYNDLEEEEKRFRFYIWQISGYKARQSFFDKRQELKNCISEKLRDEFIEIERLLTVIEKSSYYKQMNKQNLWKLDKFGIPRLVSWKKLIEQSMLKTSLFETSYKLYSNYAHSEFISLIQMNGKDVLNKGSEENNKALLSALRTVKIINCVSIVCLKNKFECISKVFEKLNKETRETILFWNEFGVE